MTHIMNYNDKWIIVKVIGVAMGDENDNLVTFDTPEDAESFMEGLTFTVEEGSVAVDEAYGFYL